MAKWRAIHSGICTSKRLVTLQEWEQLLFVQLVVQADQHGRLDADPFQVRIKCCPASSRTDNEISGAMVKMAEPQRHLIGLYRSQGINVCQVLEWDEMQPSSYLKDRGKSSLPDNTNEFTPLGSHGIPGDPSLEEKRREETRREETEDTDTPRVCAREAPSPRIPRGTNDAVIAVVEAWRLAWDCPDYRHGLNDTIAINDALADRWTVEQLCASVTGWVLDPWSGRKRNNSIRKLLEEPQKGLDLGKKQKAAAAALDWGSLND